MQLSMWTYPWDIHDQGLERVLSDVTGRSGLNTISLATSYHAGHFLQPRSLHRKSYFPEDGTVYYRPDPNLWVGKAITPQIARNVTECGDMLEQLVRARDDGGLKVSCWTVCLHNTRLGMMHQSHVTRNAFGDPNYYNLCPSSPAARDYVVTMVRDIATRYRPDMVELESPNFMGFVHGYHHEKDGVGLTAEDDFFLSLCFCDHCRLRARNLGVNFDGARAKVRGFLAAMCEREVPEPQFPDFPARGLDAFRDHAELCEFLAWRSEPVTSLIGEIRDAADEASKVVLIDLKDGFVGGVDLKAIGKVCDGAIICGYDMDPNGIADLMTHARAALGPDKYLGTGFRVFYPEMSNAEALAVRASAAASAGADGINFYNYGLIPEKRLDWVGKTIERIRG
ncbi:hypothetical protein [Rhizobium sp. BK068]|uniref:hypothetical protein n=1 Tax=Rhizobium sp. BK068 TaxID=2512130 RepID=UPI0010470AC4|nr:hypothetical protein [Rhizobium sp. BK068]TCM64534.1 hypothetical protein EV291_1457 [Rhizobium sp. BK068]